MSQVQKLFFELNNERNLKEQFLRERNDTLEKYKECQADAIVLHKQVEEMQKVLQETRTGISNAYEFGYLKETDQNDVHNMLERINEVLKGDTNS